MKSKKIKDDINKIQYLQELKRIRSILENISDFMDLLSDLKSETLDSLIKSDFKVFFLMKLLLQIYKLKVIFIVFSLVDRLNLQIT